MKLSVSGSNIVFPIDLLGIPNERMCWIARADMVVSENILRVHIFRKPFKLDPIDKIYELEKEAKRGFKRGLFPIKRTHKTGIFHHLPAKEFLQRHGIPEGEYPFDIEFEAEDENNQLIELILKIELKPQMDLRDARSLLVGVYGNNTVN